MTAGNTGTCLGSQEIRVITDKIREDEVSGAVEADWKFAAMVLDRLCLFFFSAFTLVATVSVLAVAPHIVVYWALGPQHVSMVSAGCLRG